MRLLAVNGSLRKGSQNAALLKAVAALAPPGVEVVPYEGLADLPHFNPDHDVEPAHPAVAHWRRMLAESDGVVVSSPEYAHGIPGSLKNALDWVVGSGELSKKPVVLLNAASSGGQHAQEALAEVLTTMDAAVLRGASLTGAFLKRRLDADGTLRDAGTEARLRDSLDALVAAIPLKTG